VAAGGGAGGRRQAELGEQHCPTGQALPRAAGEARPVPRATCCGDSSWNACPASACASRSSAAIRVWHASDRASVYGSAYGQLLLVALQRLRVEARPHDGHPCRTTGERRALSGGDGGRTGQ
jgi:hypothetical protein